MLSQLSSLMSFKIKWSNENHSDRQDSRELPSIDQLVGAFRALTTPYYLYGLASYIFVVVIYEIRIKAQRRRKSENYVVFIVSEIKIDSD